MVPTSVALRNIVIFRRNKGKYVANSFKISPLLLKIWTKFRVRTVVRHRGVFFLPGKCIRTIVSFTKNFCNSALIFQSTFDLLCSCKNFLMVFVRFQKEMQMRQLIRIIVPLRNEIIKSKAKLIFHFKILTYGVQLPLYVF